MTETLDLDLTDEDLPETRAYPKLVVKLGSKKYTLTCPPDYQWAAAFDALNGNGESSFLVMRDLLFLSLSEQDEKTVKALTKARDAAERVELAHVVGAYYEIMASWADLKAEELKNIGAKIPEDVNKRIEKIILKKKAAKSR